MRRDRSPAAGAGEPLTPGARASYSAFGVRSFELLSVGREGESGGGRVYRARTHDGHAVELVDATPATDRERKRVFGLSTLVGCPVRCAVCDAGGGYLGRLTAAELLGQLDFLMRETVPEGTAVPEEVHVELTRMGEPSFNRGVLEFLAALPGRYGPTRIMPLLSSVGPARTESFFEALLELKRRRYTHGDLRLQFSLYTTDEVLRRTMVPVKCLSFAELAEWGRRYVEVTPARSVEPSEPTAPFARASLDPKVLLNFPLTRELPVDVGVLRRCFEPMAFEVKLSPLNASGAAAGSGFTCLTEEPGKVEALAGAMRAAGYAVVLGDGRGPADPAGCGWFLSGALGLHVARRTLHRP